MATHNSKRSYKVCRSNVSDAFRTINRRNRKFWRKQSRLRNKRMSDAAILQVAVNDVHSEGARGVPLARIIRDCEDAKGRFCYKHVVETVFVMAREALACLTITRRSVCCFPTFFPSPRCSSLISGKVVPTAEPCC